MGERVLYIYTVHTVDGLISLTRLACVTNNKWRIFRVRRPGADVREQRRLNLHDRIEPHAMAIQILSQSRSRHTFPRVIPSEPEFESTLFPHPRPRDGGTNGRKLQDIPVCAMSISNWIRRRRNRIVSIAGHTARSNTHTYDVYNTYALRWNGETTITYKTGI